MNTSIQVPQCVPLDLSWGTLDDLAAHRKVDSSPRTCTFATATCGALLPISARPKSVATKVTYAAVNGLFAIASEKDLGAESEHSRSQVCANWSPDPMKSSRNTTGTPVAARRSASPGSAKRLSGIPKVCLAILQKRFPESVGLGNSPSTRVNTPPGSSPTSVSRVGASGPFGVPSPREEKELIKRLSVRTFEKNVNLSRSIAAMGRSASSKLASQARGRNFGSEVQARASLSASHLFSTCLMSTSPRIAQYYLRADHVSRSV